jgi:hypothetical protein
LLNAYVNLTGAKPAHVYKHPDVKVDYADFKRWQKGELLSSSKMSRRIEAFLSSQIKSPSR